MKHLTVITLIFISFNIFFSVSASVSFTVLTKKSREQAEFPVPREGHSASAAGGNVYVFGGCDLEGSTCSSY